VEVGLDADHDNRVPLQFRTLLNIDEVGPALEFIQHEPGADLLVVDVEEPAHLVPGGVGT
jgi:hypothetical protein